MRRFGSYRGIRAWALAALLIPACGIHRDAFPALAPGPQSAPGPTGDPHGEWEKAQKDVLGLHPVVNGDPYEVSMNAFWIRVEQEPFYCGETGLNAILLVYGCFRAEREEQRLGVIRYVPGKGALRHEARHAILFALGDSRWADVGH
jgi:hypothetical protein